MEQLSFPFYAETAEPQPKPKPEFDGAQAMAALIVLTERFNRWADEFPQRVNQHVNTMRAGYAR